MAEQDLGLAVLRLTVDARDAEAQLNAFRSLVNRQLSDLGGGIFNGITKDAQNAGEKVGKNLADGIEKATKRLNFKSVKDALEFKPGETIKGLQDYLNALEKVRDRLKIGSENAQKLTDRMTAVAAAMRQGRQSTAEYTDEQRRLDAALEKAQLQRKAQQAKEAAAAAREAAAADREWATAIKTIEGAQRSAARATEEANRAYRAQLDLVAGIAKKGARDVGGAIGAVGRGVGAAARTAVNVGRTGYSVGAELGIFEEPKTGPLKQSIQQVIDRFKFLGEQAKTTRGIVLRTLEGVGTGASLLEIAKNADVLKQSLNAVGVGAKATEAAVSGFAKFGQSFANLLNNGGWLTDNGNTIIGKLANALAPIEKGGASITSLTNELLQLGVKGGTAGLDAIQALVNGFTSLPPAAQAAALAAPAVFAALSGPVSKRAQEDLRRVSSLLENIGATSLKVQQELSDVINAEAKADFGKLPKLLPPAQETIKQSADQQTAALRTAKNVEDAINESRARGTRFLEKQTAEIERQISLGLRQGPSNQLPGYPAAPLPNANQYDRAIGPELNKQLTAEKKIVDEQERQRRLHRLAAEEARRRRVELQESAKAAKADADQAARAAQKEKERAETERRRRRNDAIGSAIIGGAFPALFGQGLGASVGGGLGGFAGGRIGGQFGFGLSLVGTALGAQFDAALQKGVSLAAGLDDPIGKFQELRDAALLSSRGLEKQAEALINSGREAEAAALIQADLLQTFGSQQGLDDYRSAIDTLSRSFSQAATVVASFVAGPLAALVKEVSKPSGNLTTAARYEQLVGQLTPDQYRQVDAVKIRATETARRARGGISAFLPPSEGDVTAGRLAGLQEAERLLGVEKQIVLTEQQKQDIAINTNKLRSISYRLIDAEAFGNKQLAASEQKRQINLERLNKLAALGKDAAPAAIEQINSEAALKNYQLTQQTAQEERQKWANSIASANRLADIQGQIAIESRRSGLSDIGLGALRSIEQVRSAIRAEQNAQAALRVKPGDESLINASREAAANTRLAAAKAKQDLLDAFKAAQDSVRSISRGIEDSTLQLLQLKGGNSGLNSFLSGQALYDNQQLAFQQLLPQFLRARELAARDAERFGNPNAAEQFRGLNFSGPVAGVNQRMADFIQAQRSQDRLQQDLYDSNVALVKANASLTEVAKALNDVTLNVYDNITNLTTSIDTLSSKDWSIQVSVAADGSSSAYGDLVNQAVTQ